MSTTTTMVVASATTASNSNNSNSSSNVRIQRTSARQQDSMYGLLRRYIEARDLNGTARAYENYALDLNRIMPTTGHYPLHHAVLHNAKDVCEFFLAQGADANAKTDAKNGGNSGLHLATQHGFYSIAVSLVQARADVNAQRDLDGSTPLHLACLAGDSKMVAFLEAARADSSITDHNGYTARSHAQRGGHKELVSRLKYVPVDIWSGLKAEKGYDKRVAEIRRVLEIKAKKKAAKEAKKKK